MDDSHSGIPKISRRQWFKSTAGGCAGLGAAGLFTNFGSRTSSPKTLRRLPSEIDRRSDAPISS